MRAIIALQADGAAVTYGTIAERSGVKRDTLSTHIPNLARKGWLNRSGPAGDRQYEVLQHPDGEALPQPAKASESDPKSAPQRTRVDPTDKARKSLQSATQQGKCAVCRSQPAQDGSDLCADCGQLARRAPGVGEGPLPHYDELKRAEAGERVRKRHAKGSTETTS